MKPKTKDEMIKDLKSKYGGKALKEVEAILTKSMSEYQHNRQVFIEGLYWVRHTELFRQNPRYKRSTFDAYVFDNFHLTPATFRKELWAYIHYEKDAQRWGTKLISSILEKCGRAKVLSILSEINRDQKKKKNRLSRNDIQKIIDQNRKVKITEPLDLRPSRGTLEQLLEEARQTIKDQNRTIKEQAEQTGKLKAALRKEKKLNAYQEAA